MLGQDAADLVETREIGDGPDAHAVPNRPVRKLGAVDAGAEPEESKFGDDLLRARTTPERCDLKNIASRAQYGTAIAIKSDVPIAGGVDHLRMTETRAPDLAKNIIEGEGMGLPKHLRRNGLGTGDGRHRRGGRGARHPRDAAHRPDGSPHEEDEESGVSESV